MEKKYFGTDGIRGKAFHFLDAKLAFKLGQAIAKKFNPKEVVIGEDTRQSSSMLAYGVAYGLALAGVDVKMAEVVSTPMIAYYSKVNQMIGVMVTASHNPHEDNGLKVFKSGYKMLDEEELALESYIDDDKILKADTIGKIIVSDEIENLYSKVYETLNIPQINLNIAYDSANGATYKIAKKIIEKYSLKSKQTGNTPDGLNINLNCGSTHLEEIKKLISEERADIGLSFDGDGDRLLVVGKEGEVYDGDMIVYIIAKYLKSVGKLKYETVVLTQMSNPGILKAFRDLGIKVSQTPVGDKYVSHEIVTNDYTIGGENSGHIILNDLLPSGDGLFAAMYLLKVLAENNLGLIDYTSEVEMYPQKLVNIKNVNKEVLKTEEIKTLLNEVKEELGQDALLLVRPSGTEPLVRVTISCKNEQQLDKLMDRIVSKIKEVGAI
ncbi:phosphoglucosamine mutase [Acholeplasma hippikon]|nr:phosphoglucosamine mutase [Acholeplasma hippikon]